MLLLIALRWRWGWGLLLLMGLAGVGVLIWFGWEQPLGVVLSSSTIGNLAGRLEIWYRAVAMMQDFPLTGVGMGNFAQITAVNYPLLMFNDPVPHTHNLFFQVGVDLGVPGLIAWLSCWMLAIFAGVQIYRNGIKRDDSLVISLGVGVIVSQVALGIHGFLDAVLWGMVRPAPLLWVVWGLAAAAWSVSARVPE
jgi:O-antigen ligase